MVRWQWQFLHSGRGLLLSTNQAALGIRIAGLFDTYRDFEDWWQSNTWFFLPEFVEWVEEQRSKAA